MREYDDAPHSEYGEYVISTEDVETEYIYFDIYIYYEYWVGEQPTSNPLWCQWVSYLSHPACAWSSTMQLHFRPPGGGGADHGGIRWWGWWAGSWRRIRHAGRSSPERAAACAYASGTSRPRNPVPIPTSRSNPSGLRHPIASKSWPRELHSTVIAPIPYLIFKHSQ